MDDRERAAFHEAGHAVVAQRVGIGIRYATIRSTDSSHGYVRQYASTHLLDALEQDFGELSARARRRLEGTTMMLWAGVMAEQKHLGRDLDTMELDVGCGATRPGEASQEGSDMDLITELPLRATGS